MVSKKPQAYRTISEVSEELGLAQHVLRYWETQFPQLRPIKGAGGRRRYRIEDVALLRVIQHVVHEQGLPLREARAKLRDGSAQQLMADMVARELAEEDGQDAEASWQDQADSSGDDDPQDTPTPSPDPADQPGDDAEADSARHAEPETSDGQDEDAVAADAPESESESEDHDEGQDFEEQDPEDQDRDDQESDWADHFDDVDQHDPAQDDPAQDNAAEPDLDEALAAAPTPEADMPESPAEQASAHMATEEPEMDTLDLGETAVRPKRTPSRLFRSAKTPEAAVIDEPPLTEDAPQEAAMADASPPPSDLPLGLAGMAADRARFAGARRLALLHLMRLTEQAIERRNA